jgi:hypothetical protein
LAPSPSAHFLKAPDGHGAARSGVGLRNPEVIGSNPIASPGATGWVGSNRVVRSAPRALARRG